MSLVQGIQDTIKIKKFATAKGADLVGIADLGLLKGIPTRPENLLEGFTMAVSVGVCLNDSVLARIKDRPSPSYAHVHRMANTLLDHITFDVAREIINAGFDAIPVPASEAASIAEKLDTKTVRELDWGASHFLHPAEQGSGEGCGTGMVREEPSHCESGNRSEIQACLCYYEYASHPGCAFEKQMRDMCRVREGMSCKGDHRVEL